MSVLRSFWKSDRGTARTKVLASLVGLMIASALVALVLVAVRGDKPSANRNQAAVGKTTTEQAAAATTSTASTPTSSSAPAAAPTTKPNAAKPNAAKPNAAKRSAPAQTQKSSRKTAKKPVTYTVKPGDNLTVIAAWFHQHGYGRLYELNKSVIGSDPDLIHPGLTITISKSTLTVNN